MIIYLLLLPLAVIVLILAVMELRCYLSCQFYKKQGLPVFYTFFIDGVLERFMRGEGTKNQIGFLDEDYKAVKKLGKPAYVLANFRRSSANIMVIDP